MGSDLYCCLYNWDLDRYDIVGFWSCEFWIYCISDWYVWFLFVRLFCFLICCLIDFWCRWDCCVGWGLDRMFYVIYWLELLWGCWIVGWFFFCCVWCFILGNIFVCDCWIVLVGFCYGLVFWNIWVWLFCVVCYLWFWFLFFVFFYEKFFVLYINMDFLFIGMSCFVGMIFYLESIFVILCVDDGVLW